MDYMDFIASKRHSSIDAGIEPRYIPDFLFDFQRYAVEYSVRKGRCAVFFDTGLGKTLIELVNARNYFEHTGKPTLIITPLAVAFQFVDECERFGIGSIEYSRNGKHSSEIVVCNYERISKFKPSDFGCVILDESSILKNFEGAIKAQVTEFLKKVAYRFLFTATPSPNDFVELGTSSEALGYMGYTDMLGAFFTNNEDTIKPQNIGTKWLLKGHATDSFFEWVSSWSISMRKPSDLGFDDTRFVLPDLKLNRHIVQNEDPLVIGGQTALFNYVAKSMKEIQAETRATVEKRCEKGAELAMARDISVMWCNRNDESDMLKRLTDAVELKGTMPIDKKEEILIGFSKGEFKRLITKPTITAFGLNWQHCDHTVFFPTFSYEQYYQAIRRFWRFGQTKPVTVDLVLSDGQTRVLDSLVAKTEKANRLFDKLNVSLHSQFNSRIATFNEETVFPSFLNGEHNG